MFMSDLLFVIGAADPEMEIIENLLRECGAHMTYARDSHGERVTPGNAYRMAPVPAEVVPWGGEIYFVECDAATPWPLDAYGEPASYRLVRRDDAPGEPGDLTDPADAYVRIRRIDHHRSGDPGYGRPPEEFLAASSLGQVIAKLAQLGALPPAWVTVRGLRLPQLATRYITHWDYNGRSDTRWFVGTGPDTDPVLIPQEFVLAAAADHCLGAAYRDECPGVDPVELMGWRVASRARFQGRSAAEVRADIERARITLRDAEEKFLTDAFGDTVGFVRDMRSPTPIPELVEAATRDNVSYVAGPFIGPDGRHKYTFSGSPNMVRAWMEQWAPSQGLTDIYGDPARGFAGGYATVE